MESTWQKCFFTTVFLLHSNQPLPLSAFQTFHLPTCSFKNLADHDLSQGDRGAGKPRARQHASWQTPSYPPQTLHPGYCVADSAPASPIELRVRVRQQAAGNRPHTFPPGMPLFPRNFPARSSTATHAPHWLHFRMALETEMQTVGMGPLAGEPAGFVAQTKILLAKCLKLKQRCDVCYLSPVCVVCARSTCPCSLGGHA